MAGSLSIRDDSRKTGQAGLSRRDWRGVSAAGFGVEVFTERHGAAEPLASNVAKLLHGRFVELTPAEIAAVRILLRDGPLQLGHLCDASGLTMEKLYRLVIGRVIQINIISAPLSETSLVTALRESAG